MDLYQTFIAKSRYARYRDDLGRRENWSETVQRYVDYMKNKFPDLEIDWQEIYDAIFNLEVMPSMRALMTAGKALDRDNTAGYNCSYLPVDDVKAFDEAMYILLCGTGVGFSVERQYIQKLPEVPDTLFYSQTTIVVSDSKEGWAKGLRQLIALLYSGEIPRWDLSKIRPAGTRLKTFGGRASGPEPLDELFRYVSDKFRHATGRKLTSLECHDILCKIAEVVVVGGVRRSAMISLSNLSDERMRKCKSGNWWEHDVQRALANNSAVYTDRPEMDLFLPEWLSLFQSKSGERGIFNRKASSIKAAENGRRKVEGVEFGTNPCSEIILRPYQFCNLTEVVVKAYDDYDSLAKKVRIATILGTLQSTLTYFPYLRKIWQKNTEEERLLGVSLTGVLDNDMMNDNSVNLKQTLEELRDVAINVNRDISTRIGIHPSVAITCVKPSGTVSQLCDSASGLHPRHSRYYIRRVRADNKDPLTQFMIQQGIPHEPDFTKPDSTTVFSFPIAAPSGALLRDDLSATQHFNLWLVYQRHWCEHKPSVTISVKDDEWLQVGAAVYEHFDEVAGVSFLPFDGGTYRQAPYEAIDELTYRELCAKMPTSIDWDSLIEDDDNVEGAQTLACVAGFCEIK